MHFSFLPHRALLIIPVLPFQVEPIRNFFAALFLASIGMLIHMHFLWNHVDILVAAVLLVIVIKTLVVAIVVKVFGYNNKTAVLVRSEPFLFAFTLLQTLLVVRALTVFLSIGWNVACADWGICFCSAKSSI